MLPMINRANLLADLKRVLVRLEADLLQRSESTEVPEVGASLRAEYDRARSAERTAQNYEDWRTDAITQAAAAWVLSCVFVRFLEDNQLIDPPKISGPGERLVRARDEWELYVSQAKQPNERDYLLGVFDQLARLPGTRDVFGEHNPIRELPNWLSGDAAKELLDFFQKTDADTSTLVHDFTDPNWDTRFLGDLYQDLSEAARKKYALLQTPEFVEEFILDRTLNPALDEFRLDAAAVLDQDGKPLTEAGFRMIDPACGSGHFLLGAFPRILDRWQRKEPGTNVRELVQRTLNCIHGVDVNPYAVAIARFRLLLAAMRACSITRLSDAPGFRLNLACGDSLLQSPLKTGHRVFDFELTNGDAECEHAYQAEDLPVLKKMLRGGQYHAVVANPPYITPKDRQLSERYRKRFKSCHMKYSLAVPFLERIFRLAVGPSENVSGGYTGQITANSFMKREFGKKLIEAFLPTVDLTHVIDTSGGGGAYIPGHKTGTVILFGRNRAPVSTTIRTVMGIRGEPCTPIDPAKGLVWLAILDQLDQPGTQSEYVSVGDSLRELFHKHPWSIGGGGASELKDLLDGRGARTLDKVTESIGPASFAGVDDAFVAPRGSLRRFRIASEVIRSFAGGDQLRDWHSEPEEECLTPYDEEGNALSLDGTSGWARRLWSLRRVLEAVTSFGGKSRQELGEHWWTWYRWITDRVIANPRITFAFVATHNHFILDRECIALNRSAPIVKLPGNASESDHLGLLGLLNSSIACFWMKQVFYPKATSSGDISIEKGKPEANRYEFAGTGLEKLPIPSSLTSQKSVSVCRITAKLDTTATRLQTALPAAILRNCQLEDFARLEETLRIGRETYTATLERLIALQEELDWECYQAFDLSQKGASLDIIDDESHGIPAEARPCFWQNDIAPDVVPAKWRATYEERRKLQQSTSGLAVIEDPVFKRPWWGRQGVYGRLARDYEGWTSEAIAIWLLGCLESYFDVDGRMNEAGRPTARIDIALISVATLADIARQGAEFQQVGELYRNDAAFDVQALVTELVTAESVPLLPILRYKPSGLIKRGTWERTWDLQRQEDTIDARTTLPGTDPEHLSEEAARELKQKQVGNIPVPTKYDAKDFLDSNFWRLRGKLDVPKERWISFPHCEGPDGTPVLCWAGYDHLQQARAISAYFVRVQTEFGGSDDPRLIPLLACLLELLPWLKQWHNEPDAEFDGMRMGDYFEGFVIEEARQLNKTIPEIKAWTPPPKTGGRGRRKASS